MQAAIFNIRPFCLTLRHSYNPCMSMQEPVSTCNRICNFQVKVISGTWHCINSISSFCKSVLWNRPQDSKRSVTSLELWRHPGGLVLITRDAFGPRNDQQLTDICVRLLSSILNLTGSQGSKVSTGVIIWQSWSLTDAQPSTPSSSIKGWYYVTLLPHLLQK